ncbi:MAG: NHLP family bacteriocin export ABC transporter peptidase/permease/ATPase subunit [Oscillospiraceae bacterium]|nr:NHLP family bacteriocin export ABC transporter peptidase/permease/ATPase subunit [Oscillospiraceae bacterium]
MEATECGAASLSMIFEYFGKYIPLEQMRIETGVSRDGCNAANIMRCAKKYGMEVHGYRKEPDALRTIALPCIIHWNFNHFVVFEGFKGKYAYLNDPAVGRRKLTPEELDDGFTGVVLTFKPTDQFQKEKKKGTAWQSVKKRLSGQYGVLFKLIYVGLLLVFPGLILPVLSQIFMDDILVGGYKDWLTKLLVFMGALVVLRAGLSYYRSLVLQKLQSKLTLVSGYGFLRHMLRLPVNFFDQRYAGDLVDRIDSNTDVNTFLTGDLAETVLNIFVATFYLVVLIFYSPIMTVVGMVNVVICLAAVFISTKYISGITMKQQINAGKMNGAVCAGLSITDTIKASGAETEYIERILGHQANLANLEQELNKFQQIANAIPDAAGKITDALLLMVGGILVINGEMTLGMLLAFNSLFDSFAEPVGQLVGFIQKIQALKANLNRVEDIDNYAEDERYTHKTDRKEMHRKLSGEIELRDISFGYSALKPPLVESFNFHLKSGESIAFVGASGCGKSTLSKMVSGLYKPWTGEVLADGIPLSEIPTEVLNASISTVSQNIVLFSGTIRDNLTMWNPAVYEEDLVQAAKDACIYDFIMQQKDGFEYRLSEGATNISGGQRQRLEIARALATKPTILIMDEATSALDPIVEKQILDNIKQRGCTCVIVAHRLSAIRDCNQIIVMENGKIVQRGNHRTLKDEEGYYRTFVQNL